MEIDETKPYLLIQDNGDKTVTLTSKIPDELGTILTVIVPMSFDAMLKTAGMTTSETTVQEVATSLYSKSIVVPNELE